jgi:hypothetical protein
MHRPVRISSGRRFIKDHFCVAGSRISAGMVLLCRICPLQLPFQCGQISRAHARIDRDPVKCTHYDGEVCNPYTSVQQRTLMTEVL